MKSTKPTLERYRSERSEMADEIEHAKEMVATLAMSEKRKFSSREIYNISTKSLINTRMKVPKSRRSSKIQSSFLCVRK